MIFTTLYIYNYDYIHFYSTKARFCQPPLLKYLLTLASEVKGVGFNYILEDHLPNKELADFLLEQCRQRRLSLRGLSISSGLSPATVHGIITRKYQPTIYSLNRLADYLGVKRQYLWQLAGLLEDMDYEDKTFIDPQLKFHMAQVDKLPEAARRLIISIIESLIVFLETRIGKGGHSPD